MNSVVVDSKTVNGDGANVQIGISITNDLALRNVVIPLMVRSISNGAYIKKLAVKRTAGARIGNLLTGINVYDGFTQSSSKGCYTYVGKDTTFAFGFNRIFAWADTSSHSVVGPPVAGLISCGIFMPTETKLSPGTDGATPSFHFLVDIGSSPGQFEVDSVCIGPSNHLVFVADSASTAVPRIPSFTKGVITVTGLSVQNLGGDGIPRDYALDQNYPNPFNASTVIRFNTKHDGNVKLEVFNILGQSVRTLVDEFRHFGLQSVEWDGADMSGHPVSTGLYFYRLTTDDFTDIKKMVLLK